MQLGKTIFIVSILFTLAACSGGSSSGSNTNDAHGIWTGTVTNGSGTYDSVAFIAKDGRALHYSVDGELYVASVSTNENNFSGSGTAYGDGYIEGVSVSGTFVAQNSITGTSTGGASFTYGYEDVYERDSSIALISGTYSDSDGGYTETYVIDSNGDISGSDTDGCIFGGKVSIINSEYNMYDVRLVVSNCGDINGTYRGLAALTDGENPSDTIDIMAISGSKWIVGFVPRV